MAFDLMRVQALGPGPIEIAIGDQRAETRDAQLPAMGVAGEDQRVAKFVPPVEDAEVGSVGDADSEVRVSGGRHMVELVVAQVRIVDTDEGDVPSVDGQLVMSVGQV
ncbi:MAG: hypothetical protein ACXWDC_02875, partial [Aeromicrobium sp.]